jgi:hypothetical protein
VSIQEIKNIWIEFLRELDVSVMPKGGPPASREEVLKLFDTVQHRLYARAQANFDVFLPQYRAELATRPAPDVPSGKQQHEQRVAAMRNRTTG